VRTTRHTRLATSLAAVGILAVAVAACGSSSNGGGGSTTSPSASTSTDSTAAALVPAQFKNGITVASDETYAPIDFMTTSGSITGFDYDLGQAMSKELGVPFTFTNVTFDSIIPALQAKKYDIVMSAMTDNKEREATLDFVDYYQAGTSFVVQKGNPDNLTALTGLCGKHVALEKGTTEESVVEGASTACTKAGMSAVTIDSLPTDTAALLEVKSGKAVADINDSPVASYIAQQSGGTLDSVEVASLGNAPYGIGVLKADSGLTTAIQAAFRATVADGTYAQILAKYGIASGSLTTGTIDGATS
jgi:polar amino acid transport system substrate-binding protein